MKALWRNPRCFWPAMIFATEAVYLLAFLRPYGLLDHYATPQMDLGKLGGYSDGGRLGLLAGHGAALSALRGGLSQGGRERARRRWGGSWAAACSSPSPRRPSTPSAPWTSSTTSSTAAWRPSTAPTRCSPRRTPSPDDPLYPVRGLDLVAHPLWPHLGGGGRAAQPTQRRRAAARPGGLQGAESGAVRGLRGAHRRHPAPDAARLRGRGGRALRLEPSGDPGGNGQRPQRPGPDGAGASWPSSCISAGSPLWGLAALLASVLVKFVPLALTPLFLVAGWRSARDRRAIPGGSGRAAGAGGGGAVPALLPGRDSPGRRWRCGPSTRRTCSPPPCRRCSASGWKGSWLRQAQSLARDVAMAGWAIFALWQTWRLWRDRAAATAGGSLAALAGRS